MYLEIHHKSLGQIDVDLVPAFQFPQDCLRGQSEKIMTTNHVSQEETIARKAHKL